MINIYLSYGGMITPIGMSPQENFSSMREGRSGVATVHGSGFNKENWPLGKILDLPNNNRYDSLLSSICQSLSEDIKEIVQRDDTLIIVSTTKANVDSLPNNAFNSTHRIIQTELKNKNKALVLSNACISGVLAVNTGADYLRSGQYNHVLIIGIDILSNFVTFGFQSLFAMSDSPTQPFDKERKGISLGEAAGAVLMSTKMIDGFNVEYLAGASSNDANHISGPSRTGEGLFRSVNKTAERANIDLNQIDFISAHGTGTMYNDEMESIAFDRLQLNDKPLNSLKGYFGHTLGAAGIIEILCTMLMMEHGTIIKSLGYNEPGTSCRINVQKETIESPISFALKTASGFGGGNASLILKSIE